MDPSCPAPDGADRRGSVVARLWGGYRRTLFQVASRSRCLSSGWWWVVTATLIGAVPFLVSYGLELSRHVPVSIPNPDELAGHQLLSGIVLSVLCLGCALDDAWKKGLAAIVLAFAAHALVVITLSHYRPAQSAAVLPGGAEYWHKQIRWIETGRDEEYDWRHWVPAHGTLLAGTTVYSFSSLGALTFSLGFYQVDLMNYYNAQLIDRSVRRGQAALTAWHVWSLLRGIGYLFLTFEVLSLALQVHLGVRISSWRTRGLRWSLGLSFLLADGVVKWFLLETVRLQLFENLAG